MIRVSRHIVTAHDMEAVAALLASDGDLARGGVIRKFEEAFAKAVGAKYAVAVNSGSTALYLACRAAGIGPKDTVGIPAITFPATANAPLLCGAKVEYHDDGTDWTLAHAIIPMHYAGHVAMPPKLTGQIMIEDACHALGAVWPDRFGTSVARCYSLHPAKQITCGEGGVVTTNDERIAKRLRALRHNGIIHGPSYNPWRYHWVAPSLNFWMSDIQAVLALSQLKKLSNYIWRRRLIACIYWNHLPEEARAYLLPDNKDLDSFALFPVLLNFTKIKKTKTQIMFGLLKKGVETQVHYTPLHLHPMGGGKRGDLPAAERFYDQVLSLPMHHGMKEEDALHVCTALKEVIHG